MRVIYDATRPQGVGSMMRVNGLDGWSDMGLMTKVALIGTASIVALMLFGVISVGKK